MGKWVGKCLIQTIINNYFHNKKNIYTTRNTIIIYNRIKIKHSIFHSESKNWVTMLNLLYLNRY